MDIFYFKRYILYTTSYNGKQPDHEDRDVYIDYGKGTK